MASTTDNYLHGEHGLASRPDLKRLAGAWLRWAASDDGWFLIPHGKILCRVPAA